MPTIIQNVKFYTVTEAATELNVSPQTVRSYVKDGKIRGQRIGRPILITEKAISDYLGISHEK